VGVDLRDIVIRHERTFEQLEGKCAVDAFNALYQFLTIIRQPDGTPLMDSKGRITSHASGLFYRTCSLLEKNIVPIFVFDGEPSELKKRTIAERVERKIEAEEERKKALEAGDIERAGIMAQRTARLTPKMVDESKELLQLLGLPFVQAPSEGEAQCAVMAGEGVVKYAASQDFDALLFGAPRLMRNLTIAGKRKIPRRNQFMEVVPEEIVLQESLDALGITRQKLVWIGILSGTDFNLGIRGIGPKKSLKLVKEHDSMRAILAQLKQEIDFEEIERLFLHPPSVKVSAKELILKEHDKPGVLRFMCDERDFSQERVENALARAFKEPLDKKQGTLKEWFG